MSYSNANYTIHDPGYCSEHAAINVVIFLQWKIHLTLEFQLASVQISLKNASSKSEHGFTNEHWAFGIHANRLFLSYKWSNYQFKDFICLRIWQSPIQIYFYVSTNVCGCGCGCWCKIVAMHSSYGQCKFWNCKIYLNGCALWTCELNEEET